MNSVWLVTGAGAAAHPEHKSFTGLLLNQDRYIRVRATLQAVGDDRVFASGDCCHLDDYPHVTKVSAWPGLCRLGVNVDISQNSHRERVLVSAMAAGDILCLFLCDTQAGVYAVREGPYVANNLLHLVRREALEHYEPQQGT